MLPNHTDGMRQARRRLGLSLAVLFRGGAASHPYDKGEEYKSQQKEIFRIEASWIIVCPYCIRYEKREAMKKMKFSFFTASRTFFIF